MLLHGQRRLLVLVLENKFQAELVADIHSRLPRSIVLKNDPNYIQGIPDLVVFNGKHYAILEVKRKYNAPHQPNQDYYIDYFDKWGVFSAFIFPENKEEILDAMERALQPRRKARVSRSK